MNAEAYRADLIDALTGINALSVERVVGVLVKAREDYDHVLICGNGGSASTADHLACDLLRNAGPPLQVTSLCSNAAVLTAISNDEAYESIFQDQVAKLGAPDDVLIVISASGNSPSVLRALSEADAWDLVTIAIVGFDGGKAANADFVIHVPSSSYEVVEDCHLAICHMLTSGLRARWSR